MTRRVGLHYRHHGSASESAGFISNLQAKALLKCGIGQFCCKGKHFLVVPEDLEIPIQSSELRRIIEICKDRRRIKCQAGLLDGNMKYAKPKMTVPHAWHSQPQYGAGF